MKRLIFSMILPLATALTGCAATVTHADRELAASPGHIYVYESDGNSFNTKTVFYDDGQEVVAFDAQFTPQAAQAAIDFLRTKTSHPIKYLVITHPNPDKFNGLTTFQAQGAQVIASRKTVAAIPGVDGYKKYFFVTMAKMFTADNYPKVGAVDFTFENTLTLPLASGRTIELRELTHSGVSGNQTVAYIPSMNSLVVGDLVHFKAHAWLEGGIVNGKATPTLGGWISDLQELQNIYGNQNPAVYGGRGLTTPLSQAVPEEITYLKKADKIVSSYITSLGARKSELSGPKAQDHYKILQEKFKNAFPDYSLDYMIQYGVYGLVNSKL